MEINIQQVVDQAIEDIVRKAARAALAQPAGSGIETGVKAIILEEAHRMAKEDPEIQLMIREAIVHWVRKEKGG